MSSSDFDFDFDAYHTNISLLLAMARDEYKKHFIDLPAIQDKTIKTYLWISGALLGLQLTAIEQLSALPFASEFWVTLAILISFSSFCSGIDSLRGREDSVFGIKSYAKLLSDIHRWAKNPDSERKLNISLISFLETAINAEKRINAWRAKRLRIMSYLLLFSGFATMMTIICFFMD